MSIFNLIKAQIKNLKISAVSPLLLVKWSLRSLSLLYVSAERNGRTNSMWQMPVLGLLLVAVSLFAGPQAAAQGVLVSNTSNRSTGGASVKYATKFTTGANSTGYTISSVGVFLRSVPASGSITVTIRNGSSTNPGNVIATLSNPDALAANAVNTFTAPVNTILAASTTYFLEAETGNRLELSVINATSETGATGWSIADESRIVIGGWISTTGILQFSVSGTANAAATDPTVSLTSSSLIIAEGATAITLTATRSEANDSGAPLSIPIQVKSTETTAEADDYTLGAMSISIPNGSATGTTTFSVADDGADEPSEKVVIGLGTLPAGNVAASNNEVTISITDNDATVVRLDRTGNGPVSEGGNIEFTVILSRSLVAGEVINVPLSIGGTDVTTADWRLGLKLGSSLNTGVIPFLIDTATPVLNFSGLGADTATMILTPAVDGVEEDAETFTIALGPDGDVPNGFDRAVDDAGIPQTNVGGGANPDGTNNSFNIVVNNLNPPVKPMGFTATAGDGQVTLTWNDPMNSDITKYQIRQRTSESNFGNWTDIPRSGATTTSYTISGLTNGTAYLFLIRAVAVTENSRPSDEATATPVTPEINIMAVTSPVAEDTDASFTITAVPPPAANLDVSVSVTETASSSFVNSSNKGTITVTIPAASGSVTYAVANMDDNIDESGGSVTVTIQSGTGYRVGSTASATVMVNDDDATSVTLAGVAGDLTEGEMKAFTVMLGRGLTNGEVLQVPLTFGGTATRNTDYMTACPDVLPDGVTCNNLNTATTPMVTFTGPATGMTAASVTLTLTAATDSDAESGGETVDIGLGTLNASSGTNLGGGASGTDNLALFRISDIPTSPPDAPTGLTATAGLGDGEVALSWTDPTDSDITSYQFQQKAGSGDYSEWTVITNSDAATTTHTVTELTNGTEYTFRIRASIGSTNGDASDEATSTPIAAPDKPTAFTATAGLGDGEVALSWTDPTNSDITRYQFQQKAGSGSYGSWMDISSSGAATTTHTVTGLTNGTAYTFRIRAVAGSSVSGVQSDEAMATPVAAPDKPTAFTTIAGDTEVTLSWTDPKNSDITSYQFQQKAGADSYSSWMDIGSSGAATTTHTVTSLTNGTAYTFRIRAVAGSSVSGVQSDEAMATPVAAPDKPTAFTTIAGDTEVTLSWTNPKNSDIIKYQFQQKAGADSYGSWTDIGSSDATTTTHTVTGLTNGTAYAFRIRAVAGSVNGVASDEKTATPQASAPAKPTAFTATAGDTEVTLSWTDSKNSDITKYQFQQKAGADSYGSWTDIGSSDATTTTHTITSLANGTTYAFRIRAVASSSVNGVQSDEAMATPVAAPDKPTAFTTIAGDTEVTLSWTDPRNSDITKYQFQQKAGSGSYSSWMDIGSSGAATTTHTITGLANGTTYAFRIRAVAGSVNGVASDEKTATPQASAPVKPMVTIVRGVSSVTEGTEATFTISASTVPNADLLVSLSVTEAAGSDFIASGSEGSKMVTIPASGSSVTYTIATVDDDADEANGSVTVTIIDGSDYTIGSPSSVTVTLNDDDTTPKINSVDMVDVEEGTTTVLTVIATDADGDKPTYAISGGADRTLFSINRTSGALTFISAPDFEGASADGDDDYEVEVTASDGSNSVAQAITVTVTNDPTDDVLGFSEAQDVSEVVIVPNPSSRYMEVRSSTEPAGSVFQLLSLSGKLLLEGSTNTKVDIAPLQSGLYLVQLPDGRLLKFVRE